MGGGIGILLGYTEDNLDTLERPHAATSAELGSGDYPKMVLCELASNQSKSVMAEMKKYLE